MFSSTKDTTVGDRSPTLSVPSTFGALQHETGTKNVSSPYCVQVAFLMRCKKPLTFDHVTLPERTRLRIVEKVPPPLSARKAQLKMPKMLERMRGPEEHHNRIIYGEFGVQALQGGRLKFGHFESMRIQVIRKMNEKKCFAHYRVPPLWQSITKKAVGHRGGSGKSNIKYFVTPVKEGRIIMEIGGYCVFEEVEPILRVIAGFLPFKARVVTRELLASEEGQEEKLEKMNENPFTFKYCAQNNSCGIKKWLSPYDFEYFGKYR